MSEAKRELYDLQTAHARIGMSVCLAPAILVPIFVSQSFAKFIASETEMFIYFLVGLGVSSAICLARYIALTLQRERELISDTNEGAALRYKLLDAVGNLRWTYPIIGIVIVVSYGYFFAIAIRYMRHVGAG